MTPTQEPRTVAGRALLRSIAHDHPTWPQQGLADDILAIEAEAAPSPDADVLRAAAQEWADLCNDYDLNERGQAIMSRLRAALAASRPAGETQK